jgi:hypothetical protein
MRVLNLFDNIYKASMFNQAIPGTSYNLRQIKNLLQLQLADSNVKKVLNIKTQLAFGL